MSELLRRVPLLDWLDGKIDGPIEIVFDHDTIKFYTYEGLIDWYNGFKSYSNRELYVYRTEDGNVPKVFLSTYSYI